MKNDQKLRGFQRLIAQSENIEKEPNISGNEASASLQRKALESSFYTKKTAAGLQVAILRVSLLKPYARQAVISLASPLRPAR